MLPIGHFASDIIGQQNNRNIIGPCEYRSIVHDENDRF